MIPDKRLKSYFCLDTVFNSSDRVLAESEIRVLEKGLEFAPFQRKVNEPELRRDFVKFCRLKRVKWYCQNEIFKNFSEVPAFFPKSSWNQPQGHPNLEVYLSLGKLYLLPKIHKCIENVPGRLVNSNCGTPTDVSKFFDDHLKPNLGGF